MLMRLLFGLRMYFCSCQNIDRMHELVDMFLMHACMQSDQGESNSWKEELVRSIGCLKIIKVKGVSMWNQSRARPLV